MIVRGKCGPVLISVRECAPIERVHSCASRVEVVNEKYDFVGFLVESSQNHFVGL